MNVVRANDSGRDNWVKALGDERGGACHTEPSIDKACGHEDNEKGREAAGNHFA